MFQNPVIIGAGNWGTTFAKLLSRHTPPPVLYSREQGHALEMRTQRRNERYLPGVLLPENLRFSDQIDEVLSEADLLILAIPSNAIRSFLSENLHKITKTCSILNLSKGIEMQSGMRLSTVIETIVGRGRNIATLSGPNIAGEIALGKPAIAAVASTNHDFCMELQNYISCPSFRVYTNSDLVGLECCGSLKNIIAIGAGICHGLELGDNAIAALITRGIAEISRFGLFMGANPLTFMGMAGVGDLTVTCMSAQSRNNRLGRFLAAGKTLKEAQSETKMVTEGVYTCEIVHKIATENKIYMPITLAIYNVLFMNLHPKIALQELMESSLKSEATLSLC